MTLFQIPSPLANYHEALMDAAVTRSLYRLTLHFPTISLDGWILN